MAITLLTIDAALAKQAELSRTDARHARTLFEELCDREGRLHALNVLDARLRASGFLVARRYVEVTRSGSHYRAQIVVNGERRWARDDTSPPPPRAQAAGRQPGHRARRYRLRRGARR